MDEGRGRSIVLSVLMGIFLFVGVIYAFIIAPRMNEDTLGSSDIVLDMPIQKRSIRYAEFGIIPFCENDSNSLTFEVAEDTVVYSSTDGIVTDVSANVITVEVSSGIEIEYFPVSNYAVFKDDYVSIGERLGKVVDPSLSIRVNNTRSSQYDCPYLYFNDFSKTIINDIIDTLGYDQKVCGCEYINY